MKNVLILVFLTQSALHGADIKVKKEDGRYGITKYKIAVKEDGTTVKVEHTKYQVSKDHLLLEKEQLEERIAEINLILSEVEKLK